VVGSDIPWLGFCCGGMWKVGCRGWDAEKRQSRVGCSGGYSASTLDLNIDKIWIILKLKNMSKLKPKAGFMKLYEHIGLMI